MKRRERSPALPGLVVWPEFEWTQIVLESNARMTKRARIGSQWDRHRHVVQRCAEAHMAKMLDVPRPDPLTFYLTPFNSDRFGPVQVVGFRMGLDHAWRWRGADHAVAFVGVNMHDMQSRYLGMFVPVGMTPPLRVDLDVVTENGMMTWATESAVDDQLGLDGYEGGLVYRCRVCANLGRPNPWYDASAFHRNRTKKDGIQDECKDCKSDMERERKLGIKGRVT